MDYASVMGSKWATSMRRFQVFIIDSALTVAGLILLALGGHAVWCENLALAGTALAAGLILLFSATAHRFESFKGLGIEAKIRELDKAIVKSEVSLAQMRKLSELVGATFIELNSSIGRSTTAPSVMDAYLKSRQIKKLLEDIGSDQKEINLTLMPWARTAAKDLFAHLVNLIQQYLDPILHKLSTEENLEEDGERKLILQQRFMKLLNYRQYRIDSPQTDDFAFFAKRLREFVSLTPEPIDPASLDEIHKAINIAEIEFKSISNNLVFSDIDYWTKIKPER